MKIKYLTGINSLRFFAAFFVVISHANISLTKLGVYSFSSLTFLNRGGDAVEFFFTLSGFLITYLLINEVNNTGTVSISQFYLRRVYRIWPLYFLIVLIGFVLLGYVYPSIYHKPFFNFSIPHGLLLFVFFVPNYAAKNYMVGLLNPLWSIGVEEQFYLFWAPLVKFFRNYLGLMIGIFITFSLGFYILVYNHILSIPINWEMFFITQKFYAMAIGSAFGYLLFTKKDQYIKSIFAGKPMQLLVMVIIIWHYLVGGIYTETLTFKIFISLLYGLLILNVSSIPNKIINIKMPFISYLGVISFGIYMWHMPVDYVLRLLTPKLIGLHLPTPIIIAMYYVFLILGAIAVAAISHKYFESYFLKIKNKLHPSDKINNKAGQILQTVSDIGK